MLSLIQIKSIDKYIAFYNKIAIIIINNDDNIFFCIDSLLRYKKRYNYEIIVVDYNNEKILNRIKNKYNEKVIIIKNKRKNLFYARSLGAKKAAKEFVLFLKSNQIVLHDHFLDQYLECLSINNNYLIGQWIKNKSINSKLVAKIGYYELYFDGLFLAKKSFKLIKKHALKYNVDSYINKKTIKKLGYKTCYCPYLGVINNNDKKD